MLGALSESFEDPGKNKRSPRHSFIGHYQNMLVTKNVSLDYLVTDFSKFLPGATVPDEFNTKVIRSYIGVSSLWSV